jgi:hypothetical protein
MQSFQTANELYKYNKIFHKKPLDKWTNLAHQYNCKQYGWFSYTLKKGSFGYDCMAYCLAYTFEKISSEHTIEEIAEMIHEAWSEIYTYWRDYKPWLKNKSYTKSAKPLDDIKRNQLAESAFDNKPEDEKNKDLIIAKFIQQSLYGSKLNDFSIDE